MDLALNKQQWFKCHKTKSNQTLLWIKRQPGFLCLPGVGGMHNDSASEKIDIFN